MAKHLRIIGYQQITNLSAAVGLTPASGQVNYAAFDVEGASVRYRADGTDPTSSVGGRMLRDGQYYEDGDLGKLRFIEETAGAILNITYYRRSEA